ncbi:MAG TPA: MFS transporter, partial [Burkholderiaceae bacterium]|nr:MFS transporter [Burkholderiaceae bacterium]
MTWKTRRQAVFALGTAQTLAWASSYYLPAILALPIARALELSPVWVFGAFSIALIVSGFLGPAVGRRIDARGGRDVLCASNLLLALGLVLLAAAQGPVSLIVAWLVLGAGMSMGLYEPAFATLTGLYGADARRSITHITLIAGFASTVGWPISTALELQFGWRGACIAWALAHLAIGLPLNWALPRPQRAAAPPAGTGIDAPAADGDGATPARATML